ncbi:MAG: lipocalin family protein [Paludibacter sp.]|nr:lipocalin family protein [Paludibacter sp.]
MKNKNNLFTVVLISVISMNSCAKIPEGAQVIKSFDAQRYLGKWYEIARFDFRFERNLNQTTAIYTMNDDGAIKVRNEGYNYVKKKWSQSIGKAKFAGDKTEAALKVSFFGPFYAHYNVIALDSEYKYALIVGKNLKYLWILSREKTIPNEVKQAYLEHARELGFDVDKLIWVEQE